MRPIFMSNQVGLSTFFLFMSILGGLKTFGMLGIFYGPLVLGFVVVMLSLLALLVIFSLKILNVGKKMGNK